MLLSSLFPLAQTPMSREAGSAMQKYQREITKSIDAIAPWIKRERGLVSDAIRKKVGSGNVAVMLDSGESPDLEIYKDAKKI